MEAAVEKFFDLRPFEGDRLELSFVVVVEESQSFSSICRKTEKWHSHRSVLTFTLLSNAPKGVQKSSY